MKNYLFFLFFCIFNFQVITTATGLDGSTYILSNSDGVSETLEFENGTLTSTFVDLEEGTIVDADQSYTHNVSNEIVSVTLNDGDTYQFNHLTGAGFLTDYENGEIDTSGSWEFTFTSTGYAPTSLVGKTIYIPEEGFVADYSFTEDKAYYGIPLSLDQVQGISYSYVANTSTTATLTLARETGDVIHQISFSSPTTADSNWTDLESNETGYAALEILTEDYWPSTLARWSYQGTSMNDTFYFVDEGHAVFYDASDNNFSNHELSNITYTWEQVGPRIGKLTTSLGEETLLFFESNTSGFFDWEEIGSDAGNSGQFELYAYAVGKAFESLVGSSITIGDTTYVFTSTNAVTVHSPSGTSSQEYAYLRENKDEVLLSVGSSLYKLDFYNHQYGRIIQGGSGYFSIHQNWATKGWVYYDELPWIYSNNQGEWLYQVLSVNSDSNNTELMFFEPWSNQWSQNLDLNFTDQRVFPADSEFYWEDYDDFNGTELNSTKWDVAWWDGAQPGNIENGKLTLSGTGNSYSPAQVNPQGADAVIAKMFENGGDDERPNMHSFAQVISGEIHGISAKIMIPNDAPVETGIGIVGFQFNPDGTKYSMDIELGYWFEGGPLELEFENEDPPVGEGAEVSNYEYVLGEWVDVSIIHTPTLGYLMLNDEVVLEFETTYNPNWYGFYAFNDQDPNWKEYKTYVDNVRVLRKKSHPQGWMWTEYYPWAYSYETGGWLYFELAKDSAGNPVMNYYDHNSGSWDLYGPSLNQFYDR
jgi:hypothetical protein